MELARLRGGVAGELHENGADDFVDGHAVHATEINRAFAQKTRTALDGLADDEIAVAERSGQFG